MIEIFTQSPAVYQIALKVLNGSRLEPSEGVKLFREAEPGVLGQLADHVRKAKNGENAYYIRNFHIEPTNICVNRCKFCSYSHHYSHTRWELSHEEILKKAEEQEGTVTELHITGAVHPDRDIRYYGELLKKIKDCRPGLHLKAYSAVELDYMFSKAEMSDEEGLNYLKSCGLGSIPGGGAEIFDETIRTEICGTKASGKRWLAIHEAAHRCGLPSNATMLYGHRESYEQRIDHLEKLRTLQDRTGGFNAFIPLKFRNTNNEMSAIPEVSVIEDMKMYAVARIYLDNFPHLKAYWPAVGRKLAQIAMAFGVDDMDGTINDSTRIYSLAGAEDQNPVMTVTEMKNLIVEAGRIPVERDSYYQIISGNDAATHG